MDERLARLRKKAMALPLLPGVYIMHDSEGVIIYIGKAKKLKNRVSQYFGSQNNHTEKVRQMVAHVEDFEYFIVDSEFEALILECSLIKQHTPKYNILLKDDKGYHYIHITNEAWPRITAEMQLKEDGGENIGPYNSSYYVRQAVSEAKKIYKLPLCSRSFSDDAKPLRPCLNYHIGLCQAPCTKRVKRADYLESVNGALEFLKKGSEDTVKQLTEDMNAAAENMEYEKAAKLRDRITAIAKVGERQKVVSSPKPYQDVIAFVKGAKHGCFMVFKFRNSRLCDKEYFFIDPGEDEDVLRSQFISQYYAMRDDIPPRILVDGDIESEEAVCEMLAQKRSASVVFARAQRGEQKALIEMCRSNAAEMVAQKEGAYLRDVAALDELRQLLGLKSAPEYIEAYDISNMAGRDNVAGMIVFKNGKPYKKAYRKFAIKSFEGQDDYASMNEVLVRRMNEYELHKGDEDGFGKMPDLILLDGGAGQLSAVTDIITKYNMQSATFGMVKDSHHKTRALVGQYGEIAIKPTRAVFKLISTIQDEVHRFAIGYHHQKSESGAFTMQLYEIDGVGKTRAANLIKRFKNINAIAAASVDELEETEGMSRKCAENIYNYYRNQQ